MEREHDVIDLGTASVETQGAGTFPGDDLIGLVQTGLADD